MRLHRIGALIAFLLVASIFLIAPSGASADWYRLAWDDPNVPPADGYRLYLVVDSDRSMLWEGYELQADVEVPRGTKGQIVATCFVVWSDGDADESSDSDPVEISAVGKPVNLRRIK